MAAVRSATRPLTSPLTRDLAQARAGGGAAVVTTWNPSDKGAGIVLSDGDLKATVGTSTQLVRATRAIPAGKRYWEVTVNSGATASNTVVNGAGIVDSGVAVTVAVGQAGQNFALYLNTRSVYYNSVIEMTFADVGGGVFTMMFAYDSATREVWVGVVGLGWYNSGDPAAGTGEVKILPAATNAYFASASPNDVGATGRYCTANFGATAFAGTVPTGFSAHDA